MISIIIPVYNVEKYLALCVDSILSQSYTNFEVLLIDDGSTDRSCEICENYTKVDSRIRFFSKANGGVSSARNLGIENACGKWITFVDADDELYPDALKLLVEYRLEENVDLVVAGYNFFNEGTHKIAYSTSSSSCNVNSYVRDKALTRVYQNKIGFWPWFVCSKLFKTQLIKSNNLRFNESISFSEDRLFIMEYICAMREYAKVCFSPSAIYKYRRHDDSVMSRSNRTFNARSITGVESTVLMLRAVDKSNFSLYNRFLARCDLVYSYKTQKKIMERYNVSRDLYDKLDSILYGEMSRLHYLLIVVLAKVISKFY